MAPKTTLHSRKILKAIERQLAELGIEGMRLMIDPEKEGVSADSVIKDLFDLLEYKLNVRRQIAEGTWESPKDLRDICYHKF